MVDPETRMVFWFSRTWIYLLTLVCAGFMGMALYRMAKAFTVRVRERYRVGERVLKQDARLQGRTAG